MDKNYDIAGARNTLEQLGVEIAPGEDRRLALVKQVSADNEPEEIVWVVRGVIVQKNLPPVLEKPRSTSRAGYLRQSVTVTGFGSSTFNMAVASEGELHNLFDRHFVEGSLESWDTKEGSGEKEKTLDTSNRYLTPRKDAPDMDHISFSAGVDPRGILEALAQSGFVHGEENQVLYYVAEVNAAGEKTYIPAQPQVFRIGDIVEVQMSYVVVPLKGGKHKMMAALRSIALLNSHYTKDAKDKAGMLQRAEVRGKDTLKRRVGYEAPVDKRVNMEVDALVGPSEP